MPHIVFDKKIDLSDFSRKFVPLVIRTPCIIKLEDVYLNRHRISALVPTVVIDEKNQQFLIEVFSKEEKTTIRLFPGTDPEKTRGVKTAMGCLAKMMQKGCDNTRISKSNILEFIPDEIPSC